MDLNRLDLPAPLIADLYRKVLVVPEEQVSKPRAVAKGPDQFNAEPTGESRKNVLVVVDHPDEDELPHEELSFLTNMLAACKMSLADVAVANLSRYKGNDYKELLKQFGSRIIFLFGVTPLSFGLPLSFPHFQIQPFAGATFLFAPALSEYEKDAILKSKLWVCLRRIFAV